MSTPMAPLTAFPDRYGRYTFAERHTFSPDEWAPSLEAIHLSETFDEQRTALTKALIGVGARYYGIEPINRSRFQPYMPHSQVDARLYLREGYASLCYITAGGIAIGYQSPDGECPTPAYAVVDNKAGDYHRVVRDPSEPLGEIERQLGATTLNRLAGFLHYQYPGSNIHRKLAEAGVLS